MKQGKRHNSTRPSISSRRKSSEKHRTEVSAGGLVFKRTSRGVFFAMIKDSYGRWTFPKGHVRRGESHKKTAIREVGEELGIEKLRPHGKLGTIDIWFRDRFVFKQKLVHKYIHYFLFEAHPRVKLRKEQATEKGEKIQAVAWVPLSQVKKKSSYRDLQPILEKALLRLEKLALN